MILSMKRSTKVAAETVAWGYLIQAIAGVIATLLPFTLSFSASEKAMKLIDVTRTFTIDLRTHAYIAR